MSAERDGFGFLKGKGGIAPGNDEKWSAYCKIRAFLHFRIYCLFES